MKISIAADVAKVIKRHKDVRTKQIPFAMSRTMAVVTREGAIAAARGAGEAFSKPNKLGTKNEATPIITREPKGKGKGSVFRYRFDNKAQVKRKGIDKANAAVFVLNALVDEMHAQVYGGTVKSVPDGTLGVISPTRALLKGLKGRGRLRKLNKYGNIAGFHRGALGEIKKNTSEFVDAPLDQSNKKTRHLQPGLYVRVYKDNNTARARGFARSLGQSTRRTRTARGRFSGNAGRESTLVMLLYYGYSQTYKRKFKYDQIVQDTYLRLSSAEYKKQLDEAIRTAK